MTRPPPPRRPAAALAALALAAVAADWPQWGRDSTRNAVSLETPAPLDFAFRLADEKGAVTVAERNVAWTAALGSRTVVPPVVADGLVWVCTNVRPPEDDKVPAKEWDGGVLLCLRAADGKELWRHRFPRLGPAGSWEQDFPQAALGSCPLVEGDRLWLVNNRSEVVCLDIAPLKTGNGPPAVRWTVDLRARFGVYPHLPLMNFGLAAAVATDRDRLFVVTHNGVDESHAKVPRPDAPSLVCLDKTTGAVKWTDNSPGRNILQYQISSPLRADVGGRPQVIVAQGDGWLRSFDPPTGRLLWKCDLNPKDARWELGGVGTRNYVVATPVLYDGRVYVPTGQGAEMGEGPAALYCVDPTRDGDVSPELDAGPGAGQPNPNSAVVWHTPRAVPADAPRVPFGKKKVDLLRNRGYLFCRTLASITAHGGLVYAADMFGVLYCFDARSGRLHWIEDLKGSVYGQPLWADDRVYVGTDQGDVFVFAHGREKKQLARVECDQPVRPGLVFVGGTLYVSSEHTLYAVRAPKGGRP